MAGVEPNHDRAAVELESLTEWEQVKRTSNRPKSVYLLPIVA